jgi:DNA integrity scanning protein DisA with diadenylate cyclase activity
MEAVTSVFVTAFNGIKTMGITDLLDVIIVAYLIYKVIWFVRRTNSYNLAKGVVLILIVLWLSYIFHLTMINFLLRRMVELGLIDRESDAIDFHVERVRKAYPAYFDTYSQMDELRDYLSGIENLYCVGRNGQHRYNNIDHSMCTAFEAVRAILAGSSDRSAVWSVNTEKEYHEGK